MPVPTTTPLETSSSESSETSAESCSPFLPPELISLILLKLWEAPQAPRERWALLKNIALVNRTWLVLVARVSCQDVHISTRRQAYAFLRLLIRYSPGQPADDLFTAEGSRFANEVCRSITFHVDGSGKESSGPLSKETPRPATAYDAANAIRLVLDTLLIRDYLPNLRHISLWYTDWDYGDAFGHLERGTFPPQVTSLSVHYSFPDSGGSPTYPGLMAIDWMNARLLARKTGADGVGTIRVPTLRHLSFSEMTTSCGREILKVCPNVETFEIISGPARIWALAPFPPSVRTLVLRYPSATLVDRGGLCTWKLHVALQEGLFPKGTIGRRIVVRSRLPEPVDFVALRRICKYFNAELVYERDDAQSLSFKHN